jgi:uncharacterized membrane protein SirB2
MCTSTYYGIFLGKDFERFVWLPTSLFYIYIYIVLILIFLKVSHVFRNFN